MRAAAILLLAAGSVSAQSVPLVTSPEWRVWYQNLLAAKLNACPRERPLTLYFSQAGDDVSGDGSIASPWKTLARARIVLDSAQPSGEVAVLFRRGDTWREPQGLETTTPNVTIADYGEGPKPLFTAFQPVGDASAWEPVSGAPRSYSRTMLVPVMWVKEDDDLDWPYSRQSSIGDVDATEASWYYDETTAKLYIHPKHGMNGTPTDPRVDGKSYEAVGSVIASGVCVSGPGSRVENIRTMGWGMVVPTAQRHGIESRTSGNAQAVFLGCESHYGATHCLTHASIAGGVATFVGCSGGLMLDGAGGGETVFNTYASLGVNETIFDHCTATQGTLPSGPHPTRRGQAMYGHTDGGWNQALGLTVSNALRVSDTRYGCTGPASFSNAYPAPTLADARCFIVDELMEGGDGTGELFNLAVPNTARVNGQYLNLHPPVLQLESLAPWSVSGWTINCVIQLDATAQTSDYFSFFSTPVAFYSSPKLWHTTIDVTTRPNQFVTLDHSEFSFSSASELINSVFVRRGAGSFRVNIGAPENIRSNAYYAIDAQPQGFGSSPVFLSAPPAFASAPACASPFSCAAAPLPEGVVLGFDRTRPTAIRNDIGPMESPPCGNCDESTATPALNVLDFNCFLNRFTSGSPQANCDGSTNPPVLNVLDFNCFLNVFSAGCR